nr:unnamed protein product [Callosobruchus analis]
MIWDCLFSVTKHETQRKDQQEVADKEADGDTFVCYHCKYAARSEGHLIDHMNVHKDIKHVYSCYSLESSPFDAINIKKEDVGNFRQVHRTHSMVEHSEIDEAFSLCKRLSIKKIDNPILKRHPDLIASDNSKVHECTECTYKTTSNGNFKRHMVKHRGNRITNRCIHCNKTFVFKRTLDDHIVKRHPDFIASVSRKVHECTKCSFKTVSTNYLKRHMVSHQNIAHTRITHKCIYCNKTLSSKQALDDHILNRHPDFIASVSGKVHECTECTYKTVFISQLRGHMAKHPDVAHKYITNRCIYCNKTFASTRSLNDHIVKTHPDFIASVKSKIHECTQCTYKTTISKRIREHLIAKHPEIADNHIFSRCIYCNNTFTCQRVLDDHIVKRHPDFIASVSRKVHECTKCAFKTVFTKNEIPSKDQQVVADEETDGDTFICYHCQYATGSKRHLIDHMNLHKDSKHVYSCYYCDFRTNSSILFTSHTRTHSSESTQFGAIHVKEEDFDDICQANATHPMVKHPDVAGNRKFRRLTSVSSRVHECTKCTFKTTSTSQLRRHAVTHDTAGNRITIRCIYCNKTFTTKQKLDEHIIKTHPDFIASVSSKVHECTECTYKTTNNCHMKQHMMVNHPDVTGNHISNRCIHCNKTFKTKQKLDDHIIKKHPDFIAFVTSKVHECTECTYKTTDNSHLKQHMAKHPDVAGNHIPNRCIHCNKAFTTKKRLDDHIIKKHPDFISSVKSKIHECTQCTYKTTISKRIRGHLMAKHPEIADNHIFSRCIYCNNTFTCKRHIMVGYGFYFFSVTKNEIPRKDQQVVDDEETDGDTFACCHCQYTTGSKRHLIDHMNLHKDSKHVYSCYYCDFRTNSTILFTSHTRTHSSESTQFEAIYVKEVDFDDNFCQANATHSMVKHPEVAGNRRFRRCIYCNKTFTPSVSKKIYQCSKCTFKTVSTKDLKRHIMARHPDIAGNRKFRRCIYCSKAFVRRETLDDHVIKTHPDFIASVSSRVHECTKCTFKTISSSQLRRHAVTHDIAGNRITIRCIYCNKIFTTKQRLDDHIIKAHPDFIASVSSKVHECTQCTYKTTDNSHLKQHMVKHADVADNHITNGCIYCNKTFKGTRSLDDHILRIHPDFIASVSSKVHECTECTYKTVFTGQLRRHMVNHSDLPGNHISNRCIHCNKIFTTKQRLDDHIIKSHPDFMASVTSKVHGCTECSFITTNNSHMKHHIAKHPAIAGNMTNRCIHCNKTFTTKQKLDEHILKTHPDFIASVSSKVHECTECTYKTTNNSHMKQHMVKHPDIAGNHITTRCIHCNKTFTTKQRLDDHIIKTHLDFIASVSSKVHNCTKCTYKTTSNSHLKRHMAKHSDIAGNRITIRCNYCNKTFTSTQALDDHILNSHPDFIVSVSSKIHECTKCSYKTTITTNLNRHNMTKHPEALSNRCQKACIHCNATFQTRPTYTII